MQFTCLVGQHSFTSQHRERKAQAKGGSVVSRQTGDMEATSTVRTQASDTVDIIRETPDRSASYTAGAAVRAALGCTRLRAGVVCGARKPRPGSAEIIISTRMRRARGFDARVGIHGCTDRDRRPDRARDACPPRAAAQAGPPHSRPRQAQPLWRCSSARAHAPTHACAQAPAAHAPRTPARAAISIR